MSITILLEEFGTRHPKTCCIGTLIILSLRHLENSVSRKRLSPNSPHLPKDQPSKNEPNSQESSSQEFHPQERVTPITREERTKSPHHTQTTLIRNYHSHRLVCHGPFIFLRNYFLFHQLPTSPHPPSPSPITMLYKLSKLTAFEYPIFFL